MQLTSHCPAHCLYVLLLLKLILLLPRRIMARLSRMLICMATSKDPSAPTVIPLSVPLRTHLSLINLYGNTYLYIGPAPLRCRRSVPMAAYQLTRSPRAPTPQFRPTLCALPPI